MDLSSIPSRDLLDELDRRKVTRTAAFAQSLAAEQFFSTSARKAIDGVARQAVADFLLRHGAIRLTTASESLERFTVCYTAVVVMPENLWKQPVE